MPAWRSGLRALGLMRHRPGLDVAAIEIGLSPSLKAVQLHPLFAGSARHRPAILP